MNTLSASNASRLPAHVALRRYAEAVHTCFDEHADADSLEVQSLHIDILSRIMVGAGPTLPDPDLYQLESYLNAHDAGDISTELLTCAMRSYARHTSPDYLGLLHRSLRDLSRFCQLKGRASNARSRGAVAAAMRLETECDSIVESLPQAFRW